MSVWTHLEFKPCETCAPKRNGTPRVEDLCSGCWNNNIAIARMNSLVWALRDDLQSAGVAESLWTKTVEIKRDDTIVQLGNLVEKLHNEIAELRKERP